MNDKNKHESSWFVTLLALTSMFTLGMTLIMVMVGAISYAWESGRLMAYEEVNHDCPTQDSDITDSSGVLRF